MRLIDWLDGIVRLTLLFLFCMPWVLVGCSVDWRFISFIFCSALFLFLSFLRRGRVGWIGWVVEFGLEEEVRTVVSMRYGEW